VADAEAGVFAVRTRMLSELTSKPLVVTLVGVMAPKVKVMAGVDAGSATDPDTPLAVTTDTVVTVPAGDKLAICWEVTRTEVPDWTASSCSVPVTEMATGRFGIWIAATALPRQRFERTIP